jgi:hypothetical protein
MPAGLPQAGKIHTRRLLQEGGPVGADPVNSFQEVRRKCDRRLDSHKITILRGGRLRKVAGSLARGDPSISDASEL